MSNESPLVEINKSKKQIDEEIKSFLNEKRLKVDESNVREFLVPQSEDSAARSSAKHVIRSHVMKISIAENPEGPRIRARSEAIQLRQNEEKMRALLRESNNTIGSSFVTGVDERCRLLEEQLKLPKVLPVPTDIYERLKLLEARMMEWENVQQQVVSTGCGHICQTCQKKTTLSSSLPMDTNVHREVKRKRKIEVDINNINVKRPSVQVSSLPPKINNGENSIEERLKALKEQLLQKKQ